MERAESRLTIARARPARPPTRPFRTRQLRQLRECEQVAAVCYRVRGASIEFLLVQTRGGRWTFPKGSVEPGLTHAQSAALEAFEEAGVHGRMEHLSFASYRRRELAISAHLCQVLRLGPPQESKRNRTWFSAGKAKRRLGEGRSSEEGAEFARVVDRAVARIERRNRAPGAPVPAAKQDALQTVRLEAVAAAGVQGLLAEAAQGVIGHSTLIEFAVNAQLSKLFRGGAARFTPPTEVNRALAQSLTKNLRRIPRLTGAATLSAANVQFIDNVRETPGRARTPAVGKK